MIPAPAFLTGFIDTEIGMFLEALSKLYNTGFGFFCSFSPMVTELRAFMMYTWVAEVTYSQPAIVCGKDTGHD